MKAPVLIIDGDREHSEVLHDQLKLAGYEVITAATSAAGHEAAESSSPCVIITDVSASGRASFASLKELRASYPHTPIIVSSLDARGLLEAPATLFI